MAIKHLGANSRGGDMTESQDDKFETHNDHVDLLADATQQKMNLTVGISSGNTLTLGAEDFTQNFVFHCRAEPSSPSLDGDWVLKVPATQRFFGVINDTGFTCYVESAGSPGSQVQVNNGARAALFSDGESIEEFIRDIYDMGFFAGAYTETAMFGAFVAPRPFNLPQNLPNSQAYAFTAPTETPSIDIQKNGASIGSVNFAAGVNAGTFTFNTETAFAVGDRLTLVNGSESPEETTMANISIVLRGVLP